MSDEPVTLNISTLIPLVCFPSSSAIALAWARASIAVSVIMVSLPLHLPLPLPLPLPPSGALSQFSLFLSPLFHCRAEIMGSLSTSEVFLCCFSFLWRFVSNLALSVSAFPSPCPKSWSFNGKLKCPEYSKSSGFFFS